MMLTIVIRSIYCCGGIHVPRTFPPIFILNTSSTSHYRLKRCNSTFRDAATDINCSESSNIFMLASGDHKIAKVIKDVSDWCILCIDVMYSHHFLLISLIIIHSSSHTWLSLLLIIERRRREFGHWNCTLPFAILSCCVPLWFNRQLNFLMIGSALCATPNNSV